ncbi:MAG: hypothetical protein H7245_23170 [Candidatus Saccharibacteria bacterium]|nr:hypothetical protein [Pseudorhodobacter sp.]
MTAAAISVWAYPWDLHDIGLDRALGLLADQGVTMVSLATSYHAGRFLQPGNPKRRVYFPEDGTVYYRPDPAHWTGHQITPQQAEIVASEGDMLAELTRRRDAGGLGVSCWTVCLHNTRLGLAHPDHCLRTAHGDAQIFGLCPSSPAARAYITGMVAEISYRYRPDRIELESPDYMGFAHGFHHEKDGLGLLEEDIFLLGLCFCRHCQAGAMAAGVDFEAARQTVVTLLDAAFARDLPQAQFPDFPALGPLAFGDHPALTQYLAWRSAPVKALIAEAKAACHPDTALLLIDAEGTWASGIDLAAVVPHLDGILHCAYFTPTRDIPALMARTRAVLGPDKTLIAGFQMFHPQVADAADLHARAAATTGHVDGLNFYNLGLVPASRLKWLGGITHTA